MNDRIQKLATEVGISVDYLTNTKQIVLLEKFAELIVQECIETMYDTEQITVAQFVDATLKEHFGVE